MSIPYEIKQGYIGHPGQLVTLRRVTVAEGKAKGTEIIEVKTAGGLEVDILPDAGLDIGQCRFQGVNMSWMSKNGYDSPAVIAPYENEFVNTFPGGLLYTCGLRSAGPANRDRGEWHPLHGRYHSLAAEQVCAEIVNDEIIVRGVIRETALFGHVLENRRTIRIPAFGATVTVEDEITNLTPRDEEFMQIYHCNFGYPLLSEKARLILQEERETIPRTEFAKTGLGRECAFDKPVSGEEERVFFQKMKRDFRAELVNLDLQVRMTMTWSGDTLPILSQWRSMAAGDYVLGLEPTNCYIMGRHDERENGTLPVLKAFETEKHMLVNLVEILRLAEEKKCAVGAFNTPNLECVNAVLNAAERLNVPVILSHAELHEPVAPLSVIGPVMVEKAKQAKVPVCVHLDHCETLSYMQQALNIGFTGVMYDGSLLPYEENRTNTKKAVAMAKHYNCGVEAELGALASREGGASAGSGPVYTDPDQAVVFCKETGIDALAPSFGTAHGIYKSKPVLDLDRVKAIAEKTGLPLVMHGGSGVSPDDYRTGIQNGLRKINYYSYMSKAGVTAVKELLEKEDVTFFHDLALAAQNAMEADADKAMRVFSGKILTLQK